MVCPVAAAVTVTVSAAAAERFIKDQSKLSPILNTGHASISAPVGRVYACVAPAVWVAVIIPVKSFAIVSVTAVVSAVGTGWNRPVSGFLVNVHPTVGYEASRLLDELSYHLSLLIDSGSRSRVAPIWVMDTESNNIVPTVAVFFRK